MASHDYSVSKIAAQRPLINIALDVGHSSIGWAVSTNDPDIPRILGCGVMTFGESCQNTARAGFRRMRRNIAARRNRVKRLAKLFAGMGVLTEAQIKSAPNSVPWRDAALVFADPTLTLDWPRLWNVIRWYAHNRGYDGNAAWANRIPDDDTDGDSEKERAAKALMEKHGTRTMASTVCAALGIDPAGPVSSSRIYFKGYNAAFPRKIVTEEVREILERHRGALPGVDDALIECLMKDATAHPSAPRMAKRHRGGLLFGQMVPRFDNRIIPTCLHTEKNTPNKHSRAFYRYRWAMLLGNITVAQPDGKTRPLTVSERHAMDALMRDAGRMNKTQFRKAVEEVTGCPAPKLDAFFLTEEMENALMLDPVRFGLKKHPVWSTLWDAASEPHRKVLENILFKRRRLTPGDWLEWLKADTRRVDTTELESRCAEVIAARTAEKAKKGKASKATTTEIPNDWRTEEFSFGDHKEIPSGRARYTTEILEKAADAVFRGEDPRASGGVLFTDVADPDDPVQRRLIARSMDDSTNNHLVRQRLLVLERQVNDLVEEFADNDKTKVGVIAVEVVRDLQEFSGLNAKETQKILTLKLKHHRGCAEALAKAFVAMGISDRTSASLIRKVRIADDLGWTCPYTLQKYGMQELLSEHSPLQLEHIIPYSLRPSDSLDSLVLTFAEVNAMKGQRTALAFIKEFGGQKVSGRTNLEIVSEAGYKAFVESLKISKLSAKAGPGERKTDDEKRVRNRKRLLETEHYDKRDSDFTGRDLTQTSHLVKLAARRLLAAGFAWNQVKHVPGSVTAAVRKSWRLIGALGEVVPVAKDKTKDEIRGITHLHHAVDAASIAFAVTKFPESVWKLMAKRRVKRDEAAEFHSFAKVNEDNGDWDLMPLPQATLRSLHEGLAARRVRQHLPKSYRGLRVELNPWRVLHERPDGKIELTQKSRTTEMNGDVPETHLVRKTDAIKPSKLLGYRDRSHHGKLGDNKSALVIGDNYGVALDPEPVVIPHFKVYPTLRDISGKNGGKWPRVLRNGMIIEVPKGRYAGKWKIFSVKDGSSEVKIDMGFPDLAKMQDKGDGIKREVSLKTLMNDGAVMLP